MIYVIDNGNKARIFLKELSEKNKNLINHVSHSLHNPLVNDVRTSLSPAGLHVITLISCNLISI